MGKILEEDKPDQDTVAETERNGKDPAQETDADTPSESGADSENAVDSDTELDNATEDAAAVETTEVAEEAEDFLEVETVEMEDVTPEELKTHLMNRAKTAEEQNLRLRAEFANYKRRVEKEQIEYVLYSKSEILKRLLPVVDDFKLMLDKSSAGENREGVLEGARIIYEKLVQILEKEGLEKIDALGQQFDPELHEALMMKPTEVEAEHNVIVEVFQDGFRLKDRLLRPSKVIVGQFEEN